VRADPDDAVLRIGARLIGLPGQASGQPPSLAPAVGIAITASRPAVVQTTAIAISYANLDPVPDTLIRHLSEEKGRNSS
jgi:hypothetical protein